MGTFKLMKTIYFSVILTRRHIICYIHIPPGIVIIDAVPSMVLCGTIIGRAVHDVARDVLATAEGGEEVGEIVTDTFIGA